MPLSVTSESARPRQGHGPTTSGNRDRMSSFGMISIRRQYNTEVADGAWKLM